MRAANIETIHPNELPATLPIHLEQRASRTAALLLLTVVLPAAAALLYPFLLLSGHLLADSDLRTALAADPAALLPLLVGMAFWGVLFGWPLKRIGESVARGRSVRISQEIVQVTDHPLFGIRFWYEPLPAYRGITHHVRTTLSGVRHELILVHDQPERSILVAVAPRFSAQDVEQICTLLGRAEIPSRELYKNPIARGFETVARPWQRLRAARA